MLPLVSIPVIIALFIGRRTYVSSLQRVNPAALEVPADDADDAPRRKPTAMLISTGVLLQLVALLLAFVIAPKATLLPEKANVTAELAGKATMLNAAAIKAGDLAHVFLKDVPVTVDRHIHVVKSAGDTAVVAVDQTLHVGPKASTTTKNYAVDRKTRLATTAPAGYQVEPAHGLVIGYPFQPKAADGYTSYDPTTQLTGPVHYVADTTRGGRTVHTYTTAITGRVNDANLLAGLPPALPKPALLGIVSKLPAAAQAKLAPVLGSLPALVPLHYTATTDMTAYVDTVTGAAVDQRMVQQVVAGLTVGGQDVNLVPVMALDVKVTPASVHMLAARSAKADRLLTIIGTIVPIGLVLIGLALEAAAIVRRRRNRSIVTPTSSPELADSLR